MVEISTDSNPQYKPCLFSSLKAGSSRALTVPVKALEATFAFMIQRALKAAKNEHMWRNICQPNKKQRKN